MITLILVVSVLVSMLYGVCYMRKYDMDTHACTRTMPTVDDTTACAQYMHAIAVHAYDQRMLYARHKGDKDTWVAWWVSMHYAALVDAYDDASDACDAVQHACIAQRLLATH